MAPPEPARHLPPADFADRELPTEVLPADTRLFRIHASELGAIYFGRGGTQRFDDPEQRYGVCYAALSLEGAFAETCLRQVGARLVARAFLAARSVTKIELTADLQLVRLHGPGLARMGTTSAVSAGAYDAAQAWSRAIHQHPAAPDGLIFRSNHDNAELCVALFERSRERLEPKVASGLVDDRDRLAALLDRYGMGLG